MTATGYGRNGQSGIDRAMQTAMSPPGFSRLCEDGETAPSFRYHESFRRNVMTYSVKTALLAILLGFGLQAIAADPPATHPTSPGARPMATADMGQAGAAHVLPSKKID